jgi:hypothetical protein
VVLDGFGDELERIPAREIRFARLMRQATMLADLYTLLSTRLKEAEVAEAIDDSSVRVVEYAIEPLEPESPDPIRNLALAAVLGLLLGVLFAVGREVLDRRLQPSDRIEDLYGLPTMARIPDLSVRNGRSERGATLVTIDDAQSAAAESFRNLRTNVGFARSGRGADRILITSPGPDDGKSATAANLAAAMAQRGRPTVLVDADMRRPVQHTQFNVVRAPGLSECLAADALLSCHGPEGRGDGPLAASLTKAPADLTQLAKRNAGRFDERAVLEMIDGRRQVGAHGTRDMPVWGVVFEEEGRGEPYPAYQALLKSRFLVDYLASIQEN